MMSVLSGATIRRVHELIEHVTAASMDGVVTFAHPATWSSVICLVSSIVLTIVRSCVPSVIVSPTPASLAILFCSEYARRSISVGARSVHRREP